jgi:hypothetical protein
LLLGEIVFMPGFRVFKQLDQQHQELQQAQGKGRYDHELLDVDLVQEAACDKDGDAHQSVIDCILVVDLFTPGHVDEARKQVHLLETQVAEEVSYVHCQEAKTLLATEGLGEVFPFVAVLKQIFLQKLH